MTDTMKMRVEGIELVRGCGMVPDRYEAVKVTLCAPNGTILSIDMTKTGFEIFTRRRMVIRPIAINAISLTEENL